MGRVRDFLVGLGILSSAGATVSNAGVKLLNVRNQLNKIAQTGATGREPLVSEAVGAVLKSAVKSTAAVSKKVTRKKIASSAALERKRKYNRMRMRRLRAKKAK